MIFTVTEKGPGLLPQRKENPLWNDCSSQHQHSPLSAQEQRQEHRMNNRNILDHNIETKVQSLSLAFKPGLCTVYREIKIIVKEIRRRI